MPEAFGELEIKPCEPDHFRDCDIVFSGLDSSVAGEIGKVLPRLSYSIMESFS